MKQTVYKLLALLSLFSLLLLSGCKKDKDESETPLDLPEKIEVAPYAYSMKVGTSQEFFAVGIYPDGSKVDLTEDVSWSSSSDSAKVGGDGIVTAERVGDADIVARLEGVEGSAPLEVHDKKTSSVEIDPAELDLKVGEKSEVRATAIFEDGSQQSVVFDVTGSLKDDSGIIGIAGSSIEPAAVTISSEEDELFDQFAVVEGLKEGTDKLEINFDGKSTMADVTVAKAEDPEELRIEPSDAQTAVATNVQYLAFGVYKDGSSRDLTQSVTWSVADEAIATISNNSKDKGLLQALESGKTKVEANFGEMSSRTNVTVTDNEPTLERIEVDPPIAEAFKGGVTRYTALGHYSDKSIIDITDEATWSSSDTAVAVIGNIDEWVGVTIALEKGSTNISAQFAGVTSNKSSLTVKNIEVESLVVSPVEFETPEGTHTQLTATAYFNNQTSLDVTREATWKSGDPQIAAVSTGNDYAGLVIARNEGKTEIRASFFEQSADAIVSVSAATLEKVIVTPATDSVPSGQIVKYRAVGIYSDLSWADLTLLATWASENEKVAKIGVRGASAGIASTDQPGRTRISAKVEGLEGAAALEVTEAELDLLQVTPVVSELPVGTTQQFKAIAYLTDGTTYDVTESASWESSKPKLLAVSNKEGKKGLATALEEGSTEVTAYFADLSQTVDVRVSEAALEALTVSPQLQQIPAGYAVAYAANAHYTDGTTRDVSGQASWATSDTSIATVGRGAAGGIVDTLTAGNVIISAVFEGESGISGLAVTDAVIETIQITPADLVEPAGTSGKLTAIAYYSDNTTSVVSSTVTWSSTDDEVVTVVNGGTNAGLAELLTEGSATVTANLGAVSGSVDVTVTAAELVEIVVSPLNSSVPAGVGQQFSAEGVFTDGAVTPINEDVSWTSSDITVATIDESGAAETWTAGPASIQASLNGVTGTASLEVRAAEISSIQLTPPITEEPAGTAGILTATATFTDDSTQDVSKEASWTSSNADVLAVGNGELAGLTYLLAPGTADVSAQVGGVVGSLTVTVTNAVLERILIDPVLPSLPKGRGLDFSATGVFSDGSRTPIDESVSWTSSNLNVATIGESGEAVAIGEGTTTITAADGSGIEATTTLTVTGAILESISVNPESASIPDGESETFEVTGIYSDSTTAPITSNLFWESANDSIVIVDQGVATGTSPGSTTLTVTHGPSGFSDQADITVTAATLEELLVSVDESVLALGTSSQAHVSARYSNGDVLDVTESAVWTSNKVGVVEVSNSEGEKGKLYAIGVGTATVTAAFGELTDDYSIEVVEPTLSAIRIEPQDFVLALGLSEQYLAFGDYSDGSSQDITTSVVWSSADEGVAEVGSDGLVASKSAGTARIRADLDDVRGTADLTVDDSIPVLTIAPLDASVVKDTKLRYTARLNFGSDVDDVTGDVIWTSGDEDTVDIKDGGQDVGEATGKAPGSTTISAEFYHEPSETVLQVSTDVTVLDLPREPNDAEILPADPSLPKESELQLRFYGIWNPGQPNEHRQELTADQDTSWLSDDKGVADVDNKNNKGRLKSKGNTGSTQIRANYRGVDATTTATVTD